MAGWENVLHRVTLNCHFRADVFIMLFFSVYSMADVQFLLLNHDRDLKDFRSLQEFKNPFWETNVLTVMKPWNWQKVVKQTELNSFFSSVFLKNNGFFSINVFSIWKQIFFLQEKKCLKPSEEKCLRRLRCWLFVS